MCRFISRFGHPRCSGKSLKRTTLARRGQFAHSAPVHTAASSFGTEATQLGLALPLVTLSAQLQTSLTREERAVDAANSYGNIFTL